MENQEERTEFLWNVHSYTNEYIRFADTKSQMVIGWSTLVIGALIGTNFYSEMSFWKGLGLFLLSASIVSSVISMRPRLRSIQAAGFIFWESILKYRQNQFVKAVSDVPPHELTEHLAAHLYDLANVARRKFWWISLAIWLALLGGILSGSLYIFEM